MKYILALFLFISQTACAQQQPHIIPAPVSMKSSSGFFTLSRNTEIAVRDDGDKNAAAFLNSYLKEVYGFKLGVDKQESKNYIRISTRKFIKAPEKDAYTLTVTKDGITIEGDTYAGTFYGIQTLIQLLPTSKSQPTNPKFQIPSLTINDYPRFSYRGMHLDAGRHFFPVSFIKKYIDYIALHKMNYFHWHLTEDQGWRIEIKKYPKLTEAGAWRNGTIVGRYPGIGNDNKRYGGYYTQEQVKEIVQYAAARHITVVPEIEMPGHSSAAIAAYPWLSCFPEKPTVIPTHPSEESKKQQAAGRKKLVQETWGVFEDIFCAGKDSTFIFSQDVMDEVLTLFPSKYIHVGGDEAPKNHWKLCPNCQARIKKDGLKDEHHLQSYFIQRMEKYLNSKGRVLIGWDEILEGGLAPNAIVMSWQGEKGGIEAAREKHQVIMTPEPFVYFNLSQTRYEDSVTFGRYLPLEKVYSYEPVPKELNGDDAKYVLGAQANLWTEYIKHPTTAEYNLFPRMSAMAEVLWSPKDKKNWDDFEKRLPAQFKRYQLWKAHYSNAYFGITPSLEAAPDNKGVLWKLQTKTANGKIIIETDDKRSFTYKAPVVIIKSAVATAKLYDEGGKLVHELKQPFHISKASGKTVTLAKPPMSNYAAQGGFSLVNGVYSTKGLSFPDWLGWAGADMEAVIDLGKAETVSQVKMHTLNQTPSWIWLPQYVEVFVSDDAKNFRSVGKNSEFVPDAGNGGFVDIPFPKTTARYVKVFAKNYGKIPPGNPGAGSNSLLFADEILVY